MTRVGSTRDVTRPTVRRRTHPWFGGPTWDVIWPERQGTTIWVRCRYFDTWAEAYAFAREVA